MESGKLDIDSEVKSPQEPVATYKSIPEDDSVLLAKESAKEEIKMAKHNGDTDIEDGAQELMLKDTGKINSNKEAGEVKFVSENGDAKIDIETVKQTLTGMTKEELMKFANDPFWIRLRWFMFLAFWLLWAALLAGAIAIIVMAPKCAAPEPKKVWQKSPIVRLDPAKAGGLKALLPVLEKLNSNHIKVISIESIVKKSKDGHTIDFTDIDPNLGTMEDFKLLVETAKKHEQEIVLELDPNHSSNEHPWFKDSVKRIDNKTDYYVWQAKTENGKTENGEPNNWLSVYNGSAWEWDPNRTEFYLHQFNKTQPDFNFNNPQVVKEFSDIFIFWIKLGVRGFRLGSTEYLLEDLAAGDEEPAQGGVMEGVYQTLHHVHTRNLADNSRILNQWREVVYNKTDNQGLFSLRGDIQNDMLEVFNDNSTIVDLPQKSKFLYTANDNITAFEIQFGVNSSLPTINEPKTKDPEEKKKEIWPAWDLNGEQEPLAKRLSPEVAESLTLLFSMLPGTPILSHAQTEYKNDTFAAIVKARQEPAFLYGDTETSINNGTVFAYTRLKHGSPGYLVAYQSANVSAVLDFSKLDSISEDVTVIAMSSNYNETDIAVKGKIYSNSVPLSPKSTLVVQFAPQSK